MALLLLTSGAVVNVAIAWGCVLVAVLIVDPAKPILQNAYRGADGFTWYIGRFDVWGVTIAHSSKGRDARRQHEDVKGNPEGIVPAWSCLHEPLQGEGPESRYVLGAGWPLRSLWLRVRNVNDPHIGQYGRTVTKKQWLINTGLPEVEWGPGWGVYVHGWLPFRPIWSGFMINILFYALLVWLLVATPFTARRMLRRRRGQCVKCAYPVGVSSICTECGAAVRARAEQ